MAASYDCVTLRQKPPLTTASGVLALGTNRRCRSNEFLKKHKTLQERLIAVELETTTDYPKTVANAIDYVKFYSRSPDAVIRVYQK
jgi:hypothetical protein